METKADQKRGSCSICDKWLLFVSVVMVKYYCQIPTSSITGTCIDKYWPPGTCWRWKQGMGWLKERFMINWQLAHILPGITEITTEEKFKEEGTQGVKHEVAKLGTWDLLMFCGEHCSDHRMDRGTNHVTSQSNHNLGWISFRMIKIQDSDNVSSYKKVAAKNLTNAHMVMFY